MAKQWYFRFLDQEFGPVSADDLARMVEDGQLEPDDHVRQEGTALWVPVRAVAGVARHNRSEPTDTSASTDPRGGNAGERIQPLEVKTHQCPAWRTELRPHAWRWAAGFFVGLVLLAAGLGSWSRHEAQRFPQPALFPAQTAQGQPHAAALFTTIERVLIAFDAVLIAGAVVWLVRRRFARRRRAG